VLEASTSPLKERYAVSNDSVTNLIQPGTFDDQLTDVLRNGARALLAQAVSARSRSRSFRRRSRSHPLHACDPSALCAALEAVEALLPFLYLNGISTGDFSEAHPNCPMTAAKMCRRCSLVG
jgi:hypothetical protein